MNLNAKAQYASLAMLQLADDFAGGETVPIRRIADRHGIPQRFLVQILLQLKHAGLVASTRGAAGGYRLQIPPQEITLADVLQAIEGNEKRTHCAAAASPFAPVLQEVCHDLTEAKRQRLAAITLADLVEQATVGAEPMWYI